MFEHCRSLLHWESRITLSGMSGNELSADDASQSESSSSEYTLSDDDGEYHLCPVDDQHTLTQEGARFNVQAVEGADPPILPVQDRETTDQVMIKMAQKFYNPPPSQRTFRHNERAELGSINQSPPRLHLHSVPPNTLVVHDAKSLSHIALVAFANHYPLCLRPDDIWLPIVHGVATHVQLNSEALRDKFVSFEGKRELKIVERDLALDKTPPRVWERDIFPVFSDKIRGHVGRKVANLFTRPFTTTTKSDVASSQICLMAATSKFFSFMVQTLCGIPWIELRGRQSDWEDVRARANELGDVLLPAFADSWLPHLKAVLDEFVNAYKGNVNHEFWQRMVKRTEWGASGQTTFVSGWVNNLYPYLNTGINRHVKPWQEMTTFDGPEPEDFPELLSSVKVTWDYINKIYPLHFHAGYLGMSQDANNLSLSPHVGWIITHDPEKAGEEV